jgi:hypothetical protein
LETIDFARSFLTFRIDLEARAPRTVTHKPPFTLNNARIVLECRCEISDGVTGRTEEFVLGASCKTERVGVESDIWTEPNADFVPIFSHDRFLTIKTFETADKRVAFYPVSRGIQPERQSGTIEEGGFSRVTIDLAECPGEALETPRQVVEAVLGNAPLVARTVLENGRYRAVLDYPVKTVNANERDWIYQTDTGPVIFPDLERGPEALLDGLELAFCAFNSPSWAEFLLRTSTAVGDGIRVYHYSRSVHLATTNQLIRIAR